ncbi:hypothetical protein MTAT_16900 [Moorella thermoacetica]|uniref:DUF2680 domain-containing protein n=1 Tax=Neomoorella thermoacetica TaxID=1525 RepID=A0AAC9MTX8_NEOTH|nr:hypothetical protein [Moorella thermoacetica]AOQ23160.1 hypothetical protein Maut_00697 [Moorella thermoacetica]TYL12867.1 hypothetical protein MTAT_16900 [Moorella thermoacetica]
MFKLKGKKWIAGVIALVVVMALGAGAAVAANSSSTSKWGKGEIGQFFISRLAANLGIDTSKLEQALKQSGLETVDEAVKQGVIPQDKADKIKQAIENGTWDKLGPFWEPKIGKDDDDGGPADLAAVLGMKPADLINELKSGKTLADIAKEKNLTLDQVKEKLIAQKKQVLDQKVAQGKMIQDTENKILSRLQQMDLTRFGKFRGHAETKTPAPSVQQ